MHKDVGKRVMALLLSICMIAGMVDWSGFTVRAADNWFGKVEVAAEYQPVYGGKDVEQKPANNMVKVFDKDGTLVPEDKYTLEYEDNINAGTATVIATPTEDAAAEYGTTSVRGTFNIASKGLETATVTVNNGEDYIVQRPTSNIRPSVAVDLDGTRLSGDMATSSIGAGLDYTYTLSKDSITDAEDEITIEVTVKGRNNYTGEAKGSLKVIRLDEKNFRLVYNSGGGQSEEIPVDEFGPIVDGNAKEITDPSVKAKLEVYYGNDKVADESLYELKYDNNVKASKNGKAAVYAQGTKEGQYNGFRSNSVEYTIRKYLYNPNWEGQGINVQGKVEDQSFLGAGTQIRPTAGDITLTDPDFPGEQLEYGVDYEIEDTGYGNNNEMGTGKGSMRVQGIGAYTGSMELKFDIIATILNADMIKINDDNCIYDGTSQHKNLVVTVQAADGGDVFKEGVDYKISYSTNDINAGSSHSVTVTPLSTGRLQGSAVTKTYTIHSCQLTEQMVGQIQANAPVYNGLAHTPEPTVSGVNGATMRKGTDYTITYSDNVNAGVVQVTISGKGNYTGEIKRSFEILKQTIDEGQANVVLNGIKTETYTGAEIKQNISLTVEGRLLTLDKDYGIDYQDNVNAGTATMVISGLNPNYTGSITKTFTIEQRNIKDISSRTVESPVQYTGSPIEAAVTLILSGRTLERNTDYILAYENHTKVGTGKVTITGIGNFTGSETVAFTINPRDISIGDYLVVTATGGANTDNNGGIYILSDKSKLDDNYFKYEKDKEVKPTNISIRYDNQGTINQSLMEESDYTLSYSKCDEIGTVTITVTGKGNWGGTAKVQYKIKGYLGDYGADDALTSIKAPTQIYTGSAIIPDNFEIAFDGAKKNPLSLGTDYEITNCRNNTNVTTIGVNTAKAVAEVHGKGDYYGIAQPVYFDIRPFDLEDDDWEENQYTVGKVKESYIYSGLAIEPIPEVKHYENVLSLNADYTVDYNPDGVENPNIAVNKEGEKWKFRITGSPNNYEGYKDIEFSIEPYDISNEDYAKIEVEGVGSSVVLDWFKNPDKYPDITTTAKIEGEGIIWPELKVKYTPVDIDGVERKSRYLTEDEYELSYEGNDTIGTATISIKGIGNFTGTIEETFDIKADLAGDNTELKVDEHWIYRPESAGGNRPEPTVIYTVHHEDGRADEEITLTNGEDYSVDYSDNTNATKGAGEQSALGGENPAQIIIGEIKSTDEEGNEIVTGRGVGTRSGNFDIFQKDISKAVAEEGEEKDPDLEVKNVDPDGYEYTGEPIVPNFELTYLEHTMSKGGKDDASRDYDVEAFNNINVWDGEQRSDTYATLTARVNADNKYDGNYYGKFNYKYTINPRKISEETIDGPEHRIENSRIAPMGEVMGEGDTWLGTLNKAGEWECDYTRKAITFPKEGKELIDLSDGLTITWYRDGATPVRLTEKTDYTIKYDKNIAIGDAEILIKAVEKSNYEGEYTKKFKIMASLTEVFNDEPRYMDLSYNHDVPYGIVPVYPDLKFEDKTGYEAGIEDEYKILEEGTDFVIVTESNHGELGIDDFSKNNTDIAAETDENPPTVVVAGTGHYKGNISIKYNIVPKDFSDKDSGITVEFVGSLNDEQYTNAYVYDGQPKGKIRIYNNDPKKLGTDGYDKYDNKRILTEKTHYNILEWRNNVDISTETSTASVTIEGLGPYYTGTCTLEFSIVPQPIKDATATIAPQIFDRQAKTPEVTLNFGGKTLVEGTDYSVVEYNNNTNASVNAQTDEERPCVVVQGMGNFGGTKPIYFDIAQESLTNEEDIEVTGRAIYIEGQPIKPTIIVRAKDGTTLVENQDYTVDEYTGPQEVNIPGTVKIHGMGNYKDDREVSFMIYPPNGDFVIEPIESQEFRNAPIKPEVKVSLRVSEELSMELIEGQDYVLEWDNIQNAGVNTAKVTAKGLGYFGEKGMQATQTFTITPKSIGADGAIAEGITVSDIGVAQYTGSALTPKVTLTFTPPQAAGKEDDPSKPVELVQGRDFTVDYVNNAKVGVAKAVVKGIGNYTGSIEKQFEIHANMSMVKIEPIPMQNYTGSAVTPLPVVSLGGQTLVLDKDYRVSYSNNVDRGTATITITGIEPWYVGKRTVNFDIARELSEKTAIRGVASVYTYTGSPITPPIRVEEGGALLVKGVDYEASYSQNVDAGTATVVIKGIGKYTGTASTTFQIMPQQLGRAKVSPISDQVYNGKEQNPPITVTSGDKTLQNGKDYSLVYVNSAKPGMASVIIKGEGNYTGTQTVNYRIKVPGMTGVKFSKYTSSSVTISWTKNSVVTGYEIYNAKNRRALRVKKSSTTKGTVKKLKAGTAATFRVRAYVNKDGQYYYGPFTSIKTATAPSATKISSLASKKKKQVVVKWKKVKGATQYEVYRATSKKGKYKKIGTSKKTAYTDKKATGGKKYYYKVRVCKKINKKNYYSSYSAVKSVKAKK